VNLRHKNERESNQQFFAVVRHLLLSPHAGADSTTSPVPVASATSSAAASSNTLPQQLGPSFLSFPPFTSLPSVPFASASATSTTSSTAASSANALPQRLDPAFLSFPPFNSSLLLDPLVFSNTIPQQLAPLPLFSPPFTSFPTVPVASTSAASSTASSASSSNAFLQQLAPLPRFSLPYLSGSSYSPISSSNAARFNSNSALPSVSPLSPLPIQTSSCTFSSSLRNFSLPSSSLPSLSPWSSSSSFSLVVHSSSTPSSTYHGSSSSAIPLSIQCFQWAAISCFVDSVIEIFVALLKLNPHLLPMSKHPVLRNLLDSRFDFVSFCCKQCSCPFCVLLFALECA
jgi:hypothetical protein